MTKSAKSKHTKPKATSGPRLTAPATKKTASRDNDGSLEFARKTSLEGDKTKNKATTKEAEVKKMASTKSKVGAPMQAGQTSRKGKKAWRKNVNIEDVEEKLEEIRSEERVVG